MTGVAIAQEADAPIARDDTATVAPNSSVAIPVLDNDQGAIDRSSVATATSSEAALGTLAINSRNGVITYTPYAGGATGVDTFGYTVQSPSGSLSNIAFVTVTIGSGGNQPPTVENDSISIKVGESKVVKVLANDSDTDSGLDLKSVRIVQNPLQGRAVVKGKGKVKYSHQGSTGGIDSFTYTVDDKDGLTSAIATVNVNINSSGNQPPSVQNDSLTLGVGASRVVKVLANDSDSDTGIDNRSVRIVRSPSQGRVVVSRKGKVKYFHQGSIGGNDSFTYTVKDRDGLESAVATVSVTINSLANEPPTARDDSLTLSVRGSRVIDVLANDLDGSNGIDRFSLTIVSSPRRGRAVIQSNWQILYTHRKNKPGTDSFTYTVADSSGAVSQRATVNITIDPRVSNPGLISISDLSYVGAFKISAGIFGESEASYSKGVIEVNGNSLFMTGHTRDVAIAEYRIPELVNSTRIGEIESAGNPVQNFRIIDALDLSDDQFDRDFIQGMELVNNSLVVNAQIYYGADDSESGVDLSTTVVVANANDLKNSSISAVHEMAGAARAAGWISRIPADLQGRLGASYISGNSSGPPIISRLSVGPSAFAVDFPASLSGNRARAIPTRELQGYDLANPLRDVDDATLNNNLWTHLSNARYGFIVPGTRTYMTVGHSGGHGRGVRYKTDLDDDQCPGYCPNDPDDVYNYYWLWDINEWERVKSNEILASDVEPYASGRFDLPFQTGELNDILGRINEIGGASYDEATGRLYLSLVNSNLTGCCDKLPVIVAYDIN